MQQQSSSNTPSGERLLREINQAHRDSWFRSLTFVQRTRFHGASPREETWYESMSRPGRLRIDIERDGTIVGRMLFRSDSLYQWTVGRPAVARPLIHELLLLLHDLHVGDIDRVLAGLRARGFDLSKTSTGTWEGRSVTIVGATAEDSTSRQFWVDAERGVVVRVVSTGANGARTDTRIGEYERTESGYLERRIRFFSDGRETMDEEYTSVLVGARLDEGIFLPNHEALPAWVVRYRAGRGVDERESVLDEPPRSQPLERW